MKIYVVNIDGECRHFSSKRKANKYGDIAGTLYMDIDSLPHEGCTLNDIEFWSDAIDSEIID